MAIQCFKNKTLNIFSEKDHEYWTILTYPENLDISTLQATTESMFQ